MMWVITASTVGMGIGAMGLGTRRQDWAQEGGHAGLGLLRRLLADRSACDIPGPDRLAAVPDWPGNGRYYPSLPALAAEYSPHKHRGTLMTVVLLGLRGGALLGGWVAAAWLSLVGGRGVFLIFLIGGIAPMLLLLVCVVLLPESPGYWRLAGTQTQTRTPTRTNDRSNASRRHRPPYRAASPHSAGRSKACSPLNIDGQPSASGRYISLVGSPGSSCCCGCPPLWRPWR